MKTLEQLVKEQKWTGISDMQVILTYLDINNMEEEAMDLIHELTKTKLEKLKHERKIVREWVSCLPSKYLYENYDLDTADMLHTLELDYLSRGCELSNYYLKWAREHVPNIIRPQVYFNPLVEWLDDKGIRFKGEEPIKNKQFMEYV